MSTAETLQIQSTPEVERPMDDFARLREMHTVSDELAAELRPQLWDIASKVASLTVDPARQETIGVITEIIDWSLFGKPGDQLPRGLVGVRDEERDVEYIKIDQRIPYLNDNQYSGLPESVILKFKELGMDAMTQRIIDGLDENIDQEEILITNIIKQSAEYQFLAAFDQPQLANKDTALNPYWQQVRSSQIQQEVRQAAGLDGSTPIPEGHPIEQELRRKLYHLDQETQVTKSRPESSTQGLIRARAYFTPLIEQVFDDEWASKISIEGDQFKGVYFDEQHIGGPAIRTNDPEDDGSIELSDLAWRVGSDFSDELYTGDPDCQYFSSEFAQLAIEKILDPRTKSVKEALERAMETTIEVSRDVLGEVWFGRGGPTIGDGHTILRPHSSPLVSSGEYERKIESNEATIYGYWQKVLDISTAGFVSRRELYGREIGRVETYGPTNFRRAVRLLISQAGIAPMQEEKEKDPDNDLHMQLWGQPKGQTFVPGYTATSIAQDRYEREFTFAVDPNGDPYIDCEVRLNPEKKEMLAGVYDKIGLTSLAGELRDQSDMTVYDLVNLIRKASDYHVPDETSGAWGNKDPLSSTGLRFGKVEDFAKLIQGGRLKTQCSISASFLSHSLEYLFTPGSTTTLTGYSTISEANDSIRSVGHAQTMFVHDGKQYILDATPSCPDIDRGHSPPDSGTRGADRHAADAPVLQYAENLHDGDFTELEYVEKTAPTPEERLDKLLESFAQKVKILTDSPNTIYALKAVMKLPPQDPVRKTYELLTRVRSGRIPHSEVVKAGRYVTRCSEIDMKTKRKLGIDHYPSSLLEDLRWTVWNAEWATRPEKN